MRNLSPYAWRKEMPDELRTPILKALMHYPELQTKRIIFRFAKKPFPTTLKTRPVLKSMLRIGEERTYKVSISPDLRLGQTRMDLGNLPEEVLVGWFGHELGAVIDYERRSNWGVIGKELARIVSPSYQQRIGRRADRLAKKHGLGEQIRKTKEFILKRAYISDEYKQKIRAFYPSPGQIMQLIRKEKGLEAVIS